MEFRIADTFTDSLARLTGEEQKAVKTTAFDLQLNPVQPGMQLRKLDRATEPGRPSSMLGSRSRCSTSTSKRPAGMCRSAPCISPKALSSAPLL